jgi:hypothetical protein
MLPNAPANLHPVAREAPSLQGGKRQRISWRTTPAGRRCAVELPITKVAAGERTVGIDLEMRVSGDRGTCERCRTVRRKADPQKRLRQLCRKRQARWGACLGGAGRQNRLRARQWNGRIHGFWSFDRAGRISEKHWARVGVRVERVPEHGTSATCPSCGSKEVARRPWSALRCRACWLVMEAHQAASRNIAKLNKPNLLDGAEDTPRPEALRWTKHRWADASNPLQTARLAA